tara:strand:- start:285 stop:518 length:234 start_codon:yes stop_codon:yes gene_type:complete
MISIKSPLPGTFYLTPAPGEKPFKKNGDKVTEGDIIGLVEVMKTFVEIKSEDNGIFDNYLIKNEDPVEAGQEIAHLK